MSDKLNKKNKSETVFEDVEGMQEVVMNFLVNATVEGKLLFIKDENDTIIALINKDSIEDKRSISLIAHIISKQMEIIERREKLCKPLILPNAQR